MNKSLFTAFLSGLALIATADSHAQSNITQNQSGWGNSQSISIGNSDDKPAPKKKVKPKAKLSSTQKDAETGNTQSVDVNGASGNISQNQSGRNNSQSIKIGGDGSGKTPSVTQTQTGANRKQSVVIDGKKVETKSQP